MTFEEPGYGFVDDSTPEIALASCRTIVVVAWAGRC